MQDQNYEIEQRDAGWVYVIGGKRSPVYVSRQAAIDATKGEDQARHV